MGSPPHPDGGIEAFARLRARPTDVALARHVEGAVLADEQPRRDRVEVAFEELDGTPQPRRRFPGGPERELGAGLPGGRAAEAVLVTVERAAITRRALDDLCGEGARS